MRAPSRVRRSTATSRGTTCAGSAAAARPPEAMRARASSRSTWRRIAVATSSMPAASASAPRFRSRSASPISACSGVFSPWARSAAPARARPISASRASSSASTSAASGRTSCGNASPSRRAAPERTAATRAPTAPSGRSPTTTCTAAGGDQRAGEEREIGEQVAGEAAGRVAQLRPVDRHRHPGAPLAEPLRRREQPLEQQQGLAPRPRHMCSRARPSRGAAGKRIVPSQSERETSRSSRVSTCQ